MPDPVSTTPGSEREWLEGLRIEDKFPALCDHYIEFPDDPFAGTYCKLPAGHDGAHSALYDDERRRVNAS